MDLDWTPPNGGVSKRKQLEQVEKQTGHVPEELQIIYDMELPYGYSYLYNLFWEVFSREGDFWEQIHYYQKVMGLEFDGEELTILRDLVLEARRFLGEKDSKAMKNKTKTPPSSKGGKR